MKKANLFKKFLSLVFVLTITLLLSSCQFLDLGGFSYGDKEGDNSNPSSGDIVNPAPSGDSEQLTPYEEAVSKGYRGSYTDWLVSLYDSLEYKSLYELMVENGYSGTIEDFVESLRGKDNVQITTEATSNAILSVVSILASSIDVYDETNEGKTYSASAGSGVIIFDEKDDGGAKTGVCYIITNYHVVHGSWQEVISTKTQWGRTYQETTTKTGIMPYLLVNFYGMPLGSQAAKATFIGGAASYDIALIKVESDLYKKSICKPATIGDSSKIKISEQVLAIGNPENEGISVTSGVISVPFETITMEAVDGRIDSSGRKVEDQFKEIRIDAAVNGGNSGGGLFNTKGELIGIVNAKSVDEEIEGMCYAIPINFAENLAERIKETCDGVNVLKITKPRLNITTVISDSYPVYNSETRSTSVVQEIQVYEIVSGSICEGKLQVGDTFISIEYKGVSYPITSQFSIEEVLLRARQNDTVTINFTRTTDGVSENKTVEIKLETVIDVD